MSDCVPVPPLPPLVVEAVPTLVEPPPPPPLLLPPAPPAFPCPEVPEPAVPP